jgi:cell division protein FtsW
MARKLKSDKVLFLTTLLLVCASVLMVYSASAVLAMDRYQQPYLFLFKQLTWGVLGVFLFSVVMRIDYRQYRQPLIIWTALAAAVLALVAVLFTAPINGTNRWLGGGGVGVQPSEFAKLAAVLFTAALLERRMDRIADVPYALLPIGIVVGVLAGLILLEPDYGTAVALVLIAGAMVFAAGLPYRYLAGLALTMLPVAYIVLISADYRKRRLIAFLNPWEDPLGDGFQIIQSLIAVGTGGIFGRGLMAGVQKLFYLPEPHTDFIYAVIAEELGLVGATAVLVCFCLIAWRGLRTAVRAPDRFGALLAVGLTTMVAAQAFMNISVVLGLMPTKGIPLPLVSAGGSSLLITLVGMGILVNVSQHSTADAADA